jgi:glycosyltransferase involved in cell wall biosynthesis
MIPSRKRVLFLIPAFSGGVGGAERVIITLLRHLDHTRFECHLGLVLAGSAFLDDIPAEVVVHHMRVTRMRYCLPSIVRLAWKIKPQTILSTVSYLNVMSILARFCLPRNVRLLIREAVQPSAFIENDTEHPRLWEFIHRRLYRHADKIICLSDSMLQELAEHFLVPPEKLVRIYNPVDVAMIRRKVEGTETPYSGPGPHVVAMGRLQHQKAYDVLLHSFSVVLKSIPDARLTILGEGPLEAQLKEQAGGLGLDHAVSFLGFQKNPWLYAKHADLFVLASRFEGLPNSVLEVLALGTPILATDCPGGIREIQKAARQIILVPPESPGALAGATVAALGRSKDRHGNPREMEECLRSFDLQKIVDDYSGLL